MTDNLGNTMQTQFKSNQPVDHNKNSIACHGVLASRMTIKQTDAAFAAAKRKQQESNNVK
jgi:hypothetical protein